MPAEAPRKLRTVRIGLWLIVAIATGFLLIPRLLPVPEVVSGGVTQLGPSVPMNAPFQLVDEDGRQVTEANFAGKPSAWFYGFTHCPDVCPTALAEIAVLLDQLGPDAAKLNAVFVTVDPERDTVEVIKPYVDYFDPRIIGLTGTLSNITSMVEARFATFSKMPLDGGDYVLQHPASIYLVDANGDFVGTLDAEEPLDVKLAKLKTLLGTSDF